MATVKNTEALFGQFADKAIQAWTLWVEANQKISRELVDLSASTVKEGSRLYADLQSSAVRALKDSQEKLLHYQGGFVETPNDPAGWYRKSLLTGIEGVQEAFKIAEGNAQAVFQSTERFQASADHAGKEIQQTLVSVTGKILSLYGTSAD